MCAPSTHRMSNGRSRHSPERHYLLTKGCSNGNNQWRRQYTVAPFLRRWRTRFKEGRGEEELRGWIEGQGWRTCTNICSQANELLRELSLCTQLVHLRHALVDRDLLKGNHFCQGFAKSSCACGQRDIRQVSWSEVHRNCYQWNPSSFV